MGRGKKHSNQNLEYKAAQLHELPRAGGPCYWGPAEDPALTRSNKAKKILTATDRLLIDYGIHMVAPYVSFCSLKMMVMGILAAEAPSPCQLGPDRVTIHSGICPLWHYLLYFIS